MELKAAEVPPRQRSGLAWDDDGDGLPDPFVRILIGDRLVYESETVDESLAPEWGSVLTKNIAVPAGSVLRVELWDRDGLTHDAIGTWSNQGLPATALPDADARLLLEGGATLVFRVQRPRPHRGVGVRLYEFRGDALLVLEVEERSPAGRAGLRAGDRIVVIGGQTVDELGEARAATALSLASQRHESLTVVRESGREELELDQGYVWLTL
jgi:membrane-associated protease RseP (regulator of RpoE activity)